jgi:hypothetical protein
MHGVQLKSRLEKGQKKQGLPPRDGMVISQHLSPTAPTRDLARVSCSAGPDLR